MKKDEFRNINLLPFFLLPMVFLLGIIILLILKEIIPAIICLSIEILMVVSFYMAR